MTYTYEVDYSNDTAEYHPSRMTEWQQDATPWTLIIKHGRKSYRFDYWTGPAISDDPTPADILECLVSDAEMGRQSFEEFCADLGYDTDSRSAYATWQACADTAVTLRTIYGTLDAAQQEVDTLNDLND